MPWILLVPIWVFAILTGPMHALHPERRWHCFEPVGVTARVAIPWPIRRGDYVGNPFPVGTKNMCTGDVFNGQWWYKP